MAAFGLIVNSSVLYIFELRNGRCLFSQAILTSQAVLAKVIRPVYMSLNVLGPSLVLIVCNIIFIRELRTREEKKDNNGANDAGKFICAQKKEQIIQKKKNMQEYIKIVMVASISYLVCTVCVTVITTLASRTDPGTELRLLLRSIGVTFGLINTSANFLFYLMSGKAYRVSFLKAISAKFRTGANRPK